MNPSANVLLPADYQLPTHWHSPIAIKVPITRSIVSVAKLRKTGGRNHGRRALERATEDQAMDDAEGLREKGDAH